MRIPRLYQPHLTTSIIILNERNAHYVTQVLRKNVGDPLILLDGEGHVFPAVIQSISKKEVSAQLQPEIQSDTESPIAIHLYQGLCRGEKMDFVLQKAVELGVTAITPLITEYTEVKLFADKLEKRMLHWQGVIIGACEQSGRTRLPLLSQPITLTDEGYFLTTLHTMPAYVLSPDATQSITHIKPTKELALFVGPEGGFSETEMQLLMTNKVTPVSIGPRILRTETAALAALSVLQACLGDF